MLGRSSIRMSFRFRGGVAVEVEAFGIVKPFRVDDGGFLLTSDPSLDCDVLAFGTAILLSAVRTPNCSEVERVALARKEGN